LNLEIEHVETPNALARDIVITDVAVVAANRLIATRAKGVGAGTGEDDRADRDVVAGPFEGVGEFEEGLGAKGVSPFGSIDRDAGNPFTHLIDDVVELAGLLERRERGLAELFNGVDW
jgi:hypothetical protein